MLRIFTLLVYLTFLSLNAEAQILNIERLRMEKDTAKPFFSKTTAGLNSFNRSAAENAPVNLFGYNLNFSALYYPGQHAYMVISTFDYLRINDNDFLNFGFVHARANFYREKVLNYEAFVQYSYDNFRGLFPRYIAGGSTRIRLLKTDKVSLTLGVGAFFEDETWINRLTDETVNAKFIKNSTYLGIRFSINEFVDFNSINYYQVGYDNAIEAFRNRFSSTTIINTKITEKFSLTNSLEINYEDRPIVPITKLIFAFRTGISFDF
jgi:hypothetical protein